VASTFDILSSQEPCAICRSFTGGLQINCKRRKLWLVAEPLVVAPESVKTAGEHRKPSTSTQ